jgi:CHAT domain-containing protein
MLPGQDAGNSYLVLGDGTALSLNEINASSDINFNGVDLLVLSACSTARPTEGSGIEVEGLGAIAQLKGAKAVLATLWNVADDSTSEFMTQFYDEIQNPDVDKAQAIQRIQEDFITGKIKPDIEEKNRDYSHPYYWAPYILMGNWK